MKRLLKIILVLLPGLSFAQDLFFNQPTKKQADSLELLLKHTDNDSVKMVIGNELGNYYLEKDNAKAYYFINQELLFARKLNQPLWEVSAIDGLGYLEGLSGNYPESLRHANAGIKIAENDNCERNAWRITEFAKDGSPRKARLYMLANLYQKFAFLYGKAGNNAKSLSAYLKALKIAESADDKVGLSLYSEDLGVYYLGVNKLDSALFFTNSAVAFANASGFKLYLGNDLVILGRIYFGKRDYKVAKKTFFESIKVNRQQNNGRSLPYSYVALAELYNATGKIDSGICYATMALRDFKIQRDKPGTNEAYRTLFAAYKLLGRTDSAFFYLQYSKTLGDSLSAAEKTKVSQYLNVGFNEQLRVQELEKEKVLYQSRIRIFALLAGLGFFIAIGIILWRNNRKQNHTNQLLNEQKEEISAQRDNLEHQNRELEIEAALERVRTVAMGMSKADDMLEVCKTISRQLELLGLKEIRNVQTAIFYEERATYMNYEHYARHDRNVITETSYVNNEKHAEFAERMQKGYGQFFELHIPQTELKGWLTYQKTTNVFIDTHLENAASLSYYWYSLAAVALGISTYVPLKEEEKILFKRFLKVFELSFKRYLDIKQAAEQARESRIQTALERVRAAAMGMKKSEEVLGVCEVMYTELLALGFKNIRNAQIAIKSQNKQSYLICVYSPSEAVTLQEAPFGSPIVKELFDELEKSKDAFYQREFSGQKFEDWRKWRESLLPVTDVEAGATSLCFYLYSIGVGHLGISTYNPITPEQIEILKRFKKVFELAYTRYTDVAQAEAQARESQIQLALERVRARTMAMQRSEELSETVFVLFQQFKELGENPDQATIGIINEKERVIDYWVTMHGNQNDKVYKFSIDEPDVTRKIYDAWKAQKSSLVIDLSGQPLRDFMEYRASMGGAPARPDEKRRIINVAIFSKGLINVQSTAERSEESITLLERFAQVFEQTYTRFLDLQKAEKQARQAQIEVAMEKVRSRSLAMQKPDELVEVAQLLRQEMALLGVEELETSSIYIHHEESGKTECWYAIKDEHKLVADHMNINLKDTWVGKQMLKFYRSDKNQVSIVMQGENRKEWINYCSKQSKLLDGFYGDNIPDRTYHLCKFSGGYMGAASPGEISAESWDLLQRATAVFSFAYTRFSDLQQAEAQAREAKIEASLERVRSRSMGMQKSEELKEIIKVVYEQLVQLNILAEHAGFIMDYKANDDMHIWLADKHYAPSRVTVPYFDSPHWNSFNEAKAKGLDFFANHHTFEEKDKFYQDLFKLIPGVTNETKEYYFNCPGLAISTVLLDNVGLYIENFSGIRYTDEENSILMRFGKVFQQTYTRFLDLQKAEAQARESQIQLALERVRARTMAMYKSDELSEVAGLLFEQVKDLGIKAWTTGFNVWSDNNDSFRSYLTNPEGGFIQSSVVDVSQSTILKKTRDARKSGVEFFAGYSEGKEAEALHLALRKMAGENAKLLEFPSSHVDHFVFGSKVSLMFITYEPVPEAHDIFKRFGKVFEQTYTRFLDLQKAEAQVREAQIEAALERVRSRTMAMHSSQDVADTSVIMFQELVKLGVEPTVRCGISIMGTANDLEVWTASLKDDGSITLNIGQVDVMAHPLLSHVFSAWKNKEQSATYELTGDAVRSYFQALNDAPGYPFKYQMDSLPEKWGINAFFFTEGCLFAFTGDPLSLEMSQVFKRFAGVFGQTYTRFLDLQKAEVQAREAIKQASVDRVRGEIASMRTTQDLERIIPLVWNELTILSIPFIRCGVFIVNEEAKLIHTHLSTPDGKALAAFDLSFDDESISPDVLPAWRKKQMAAMHWSAEKFAAYTKNLVSQGTVKSGGKYVTERPDTPLDLHFFPFLQGMLYVGNTAPLSNDEKDLVQSLADAFSTAYARYEDFNKLEAAKQQVDKTLVDLTAAQKQLVQSEKMASLGELTAGIAHEIQNPLNFVNNFSEVSAELIDEMTEELDKGDIEEVKAIAGDIKDNLEKIRHHGKRADGIVKGMLQHSRASSGQKEPTDLNVLADEYLRLSYHGLRAKDKSFNAELVTHFDKGLPKVSVIPQEMGRVILNLINNAFYATQQKQKTAAMDYKPEVTVSTSAINGQVIISVKDNGIGIPDAIKEKIMQPFFTTKPTGEGTGLGLSLSYDILVKGHNGTLDIISKEGEGSEFVVKLPLN